MHRFHCRLRPPGRGRGSAPPKDLAKWKEAVSAFVRHYREIGIPFGANEVWNELDAIYGFFTGTEAEYQPDLANFRIPLKSLAPVG